MELTFLMRCLNAFTKQNIGDSVDRLNYFVTAYGLVLFATLLLAHCTLGSSVTCWLPTEMHYWKDWVEQYCFMESTYNVLPWEKIPRSFEGRKATELQYYQWLWTILSFMGICFFLPEKVWGRLRRQSAIDYEWVILKSKKLRTTEEDTDLRDRIVNRICSYLQIGTTKTVAGPPGAAGSPIAPPLTAAGEEKSGEKGGTGGNEKNGAVNPAAAAIGWKPRRIFTVVNTGNHSWLLSSTAFLCYLLVKLLYLINLVWQVFVLQHFLGPNYIQWCWRSVLSLSVRANEGISPFPKVAVCDYEVREIGRRNRYTTECLLRINLWNEVIFLVIWVWFHYLAVRLVINFFFYFMHTSLSHRIRTVRSLIRFDELKLLADEETEIVEAFVRKGLGLDGFLLLRFLEIHAQWTVTQDICTHLYNRFRRAFKGQPPLVSATSAASDGDAMLGDLGRLLGLSLA